MLGTLCLLILLDSLCKVVKSRTSTASILLTWSVLGFGLHNRVAMKGHSALRTGVYVISWKGNPALVTLFEIPTDV
jgi:hypothetical protein